MTIVRRILPVLLAAVLLSACGETKDVLPEIEQEVKQEVETVLEEVEPTPEPTQTPEEAKTMASTASNATKDAPQVTDPSTWNDAGKTIMEALEKQYAPYGMTLQAKEGTPYFLAVNRDANVVTVYTADEDGRYTVPFMAMVCSGGVDSTTCLALAIEKHGKENVCALSIYYGQKHVKEIQAAKAVLEYYGIEGTSLDLTPVFAYSDCSLLSHSTEDIPEESYAEQLAQRGGKPVTTYVPFRNGLFLSAAASVALSKNCSVIYYGAHHDDAAGNAYPDCSEEFVNAMNHSIVLGSGGDVRIEAPFVRWNKAQIVAEGLRLQVPYQLTWSCYEGGDKPCGKCGTCLDRIRAFEANGVTDPAMK